MHIHLWDESHNADPVKYEETMVETDLKPNEIYEDDHIQWTGKIVIEGKTYHIELRQPIKY